VWESAKERESEKNAGRLGYLGFNGMIYFTETYCTATIADSLEDIGVR
jgi:hypothetical protein